MNAIFKYELKSMFKAMLIWALAVGGMGFICILLYKSMENSIADMAESFAQMGSFSEAFGMNTLSMATLKGYFATEIGTIHALGSGMFAASMATIILSKEEDAHTAEFTFTLPISRVKVIVAKFAAVLSILIVFTVICFAMYAIGFISLNEESFASELITFMLFQLMMNVEIAAICFMISAVSKKNKLGTGISVAMFLYVFDLMARVIPDLKDVMFITPFSYANATAIFSKADLNLQALIVGASVIIIVTVVAGTIYNNKDLAS